MNCTIVVYFQNTFPFNSPFKLYCANHTPYNDPFLHDYFGGPSESYWIVPGTYREDET